MAEFKKVITNKGQELITAAAFDSGELAVKYIVIGDANGESYEPSEEQTVLVNQRNKLLITERIVNSPTRYTFLVQIPQDIDYYIIREIGLVDENDNLIEIAQMEQETYIQSDNLVQQLTIGIQIDVGQSSTVIVLADTNIETASKDFVNNNFQKLNEKNQANGYAGLNENGKLPLSKLSSTNLSSFTDDLGSTPAHTHEQYLTAHQSLTHLVNKELSNLSSVGLAKLQYAPFAINYGTKNSVTGANTTLYTPTQPETIYVEKKFVQPVLSANGTLGGADFAVQAVSEATAKYAAYKAFDNNGSTYWESERTTGSKWLKIYNPTALRITTINTKAYHWANKYNIQNIVVEGSNDNSSWTEISSEIDTVENDNQTISLENENFYKYYKLTITSNSYPSLYSIDITATYLQAKTIYVGTDLICKSCTITTVKGYSKSFDEEVVYSITNEADGIYKVFKDYVTGALILGNNLFVGTAYPQNPSNNDYFLDYARSPLTLYKYNGAAWEKANNLVLLGSISIVSGTIRAVNNVVYNITQQGQWVQANGVVQSLPTDEGPLDVGKYTYDLSSYLPDDGFDYEILIGSVAKTSAANSYSSILFSSSLLDPVANSISYSHFITYNQLYGSNLFTIPVGNDREVSIDIRNSSVSYMYTRVYGYRRIGVI